MNRPLAWAAAIVVAVAGTGCTAGEDPSSAVSPRSATPSSHPSTTAEPSAATTGEPQQSPDTTELSWTEAGSFGADAGAAVANDVVAALDGLVAVGVEYETPLPNLGPMPPHGARIWLSADGREWDQVDVEDLGQNVLLTDVYVAADGAVVAVGERREALEGQLGNPIGTVAWQSTDGTTWVEVPSGFPGGAVARDVRQGTRGFVAWVVPDPRAPTSQLWFSSDGRAWHHVRDLPEGDVSIGAGPEGFVAVGTVGPQAERSAMAIASSDGREWHDAEAAPENAVLVAPLGPDWVALSYDFGVSPPSDRTITWFSTNGLEWEPRGEVSLEPVPAEDVTCTPIPARATGAGGWVVLGTTLSYPCSEGGFAVHGSQHISTDGASWTALPFGDGTPGTAGSGALVRGGAAIGGDLVLVGEADHRAAFWIGEAP